MTPLAVEEFRDEDWRGTYYELAMELSPAPSTRGDARLTAALETLSTAIDRCDGPANPSDAPPDEDVHAGETEFVHSLYGVLPLIEERRLGMRALVLRERGGSDWLDLCVPSGMLERAGYRLDDPLSDGFLGALDRTFLSIADAVCASAPFDLALVGEEVSGLLHARDFSARPEAAAWYLRRGGVLVRPALLDHLSTRVVADRRPSGLFWIPLYERSSL